MGSLRRVHEINDLLRDLCISENFVFINNDCIGKDYLWNDGIHLLNEGKDILVNNFIDSINNLYNQSNIIQD